MSEREEKVVERLRRAYEAFSRGDFDTAIEVAHQDIEVVAPGGNSIRGAAAVRAWMEPDAIEDQTMVPTEFHVNGDRVLARQRTRGRGAGSGIELEVETWLVWTLDEDGLATRAETFLIDQRDEAFRAAGLTL